MVIGKVSGLGLRGNTEVVNTTLTATLEILFVVGPLKNTISVSLTQVHYWEKHVHVRLGKESGPRLTKNRGNSHYAFGQDSSDLSIRQKGQE